MNSGRAVAEISGENCVVIHLRELRGDRTLSDVAARVGMRQDVLGKIERGETSGIKYETVLKLCLEFQVGPEEIFSIEPVATKAVTPLEQVLEAITAGTLLIHQVPDRRRPTSLRPAEEIDLSDYEELVDLEEIPTRRGRSRSLATRLN